MKWEPLVDTTWESVTNKGCTTTATDGGRKLTISMKDVETTSGDIEIALGLDTVRLCKPSTPPHVGANVLSAHAEHRYQTGLNTGQAEGYERGYREGFREAQSHRAAPGGVSVPSEVREAMTEALGMIEELLAITGMRYHNSHAVRVRIATRLDEMRGLEWLKRAQGEG